MTVAGRSVPLRKPRAVKSIRQTAAELGLTRQQVVEAEKRGLRKLRDALEGWRD